MGDLKYLDFDLAIEPAGDGFVARVFNSPGGQASAAFKTPFSDLEVENFLLRVGRTRHAVRRIESPEMASAKVFGGQLFDGVFAGDVRGCLRSSIDEANRQGAGLRVRLHLGKVPQLADLPWEFLYNASMNRFLTLSVDTPLVRFLDLPERIRPIAVRPPLRILMVISSPTDFPRLDVKRETEKMKEALSDLEQRGMVAVEVQETATLAELQKKLRGGQYHIFHFVGHGGFDTQTQDGVLVLEDAEERGRRVSAQFLGTLLHDHRPLRLAVLNACEGGRTSRNDPFAGTAQSLLQQGIPAVIAMQFEVTDEAAICFTREFYASIASGYPVDAALAEARKAIFSEVSEIEWGTPVLYMRAPDGRVFDIEHDATAGREAVRRREEEAASAEERTRQLAELKRGAAGAMAAELWDDAVEKWRALLALTPDDKDAKARLVEARHQQDCAATYARGRAHFDKRSWRAALAEFHQVQQMAQDYKDVPALVAAIERELRAPAPSEATVAAVTPPMQVPPAVYTPRPAMDAPTTAPVAASRGGVGKFIAVAAVVVALIGFGIYIADQRQSSSGSSSYTPPDSSGSGSASGGEGVPLATRRAIEAAVTRANLAEIEAYRTLDPAPLYGVYTGTALSESLAQVALVRASGLFVESQVTGQTVDNFELIAGGRRAQVDVTARLTANFLQQITRLCVQRIQNHLARTTTYLEFTGTDWIVYDTDVLSGQPVPVPCR